MRRRKEYIFGVREERMVDWAKERMEKIYTSFGGGLLELCNTVDIIAEDIRTLKILGIKEPMLLTFDNILEGFRSFKWDDENDSAEDFKEYSIIYRLKKETNINDKEYEGHENYFLENNGYVTGKCDDGRYLTYYTWNGLTFTVTEGEGGSYLFAVSPPEGYFCSNSALYNDLSKVGYSFKSYWDYKLGETGSDHRQCAVCGRYINSDDNIYFRYCPYCGRRFISEK